MPMVGEGGGDWGPGDNTGIECCQFLSFDSLSCNLILNLI